MIIIGCARGQMIGHEQVLSVRCQGRSHRLSGHRNHCHLLTKIQINDTDIVRELVTHVQGLAIRRHSDRHRRVAHGDTLHNPGAVKIYDLHTALWHSTGYVETAPVGTQGQTHGAIAHGHVLNHLLQRHIKRCHCLRRGLGHIEPLRTSIGHQRHG